MDVREFVAQSITRIRQGTLDLAQGLSQEDLAWKPAPFANPAGFLLFHTFRVEDRYFHSWLAGAEQLWASERWNKRWQIPEPFEDAPDLWYSETGNSWLPEQVAQWPVPPKEELLEYGRRVRERALRILEGFDAARLEVAPRPERPDFTYAYYLHMSSHHEAMHLGQLDYIVGLKRGVMGV